MPFFAVAFCFLQNLDVGKKRVQGKGEARGGECRRSGHMLPAGLAFVHTW